MRNDRNSARRRPDDAHDRYFFGVQRILDATFWWPIGWLLFLAIFTFERNDAGLSVMPAVWGVAYLFLAPGLVWLAWRDGVSVSYAAKLLAIGAAPSLLLLPGWPGTQLPWIWLSLPLLLAWGVGAQIVLFNGLPDAPHRRRWLLAGAAAGCAGSAIGAAVLVYAFRPKATDTPFEQTLAWSLSGLYLATALFMAWQAFDLVRQWRRIA